MTESEAPKIEIGKFTFSKFYGGESRWPTEVSMDWVEVGPDSWYGDSDCEMGVTREDSIKLINFLKESFEISNDELELAKIK
jgi:hypothetical protein